MLYRSLAVTYLLILISVHAALKTEELVGGYPAYPANHKYQAPIIGKYNSSLARFLVCNGAIIGNFHVLSGHQCFFNKLTGGLKKMAFYVLVGKVHLTAFDPPEIEIDIIYIMTILHGVPVDDIAVAKLKYSLNLNENTQYLGYLKIPPQDQTYEHSILVAGYGSKTNEQSLKAPKLFQQLMSSHAEYNLTYAYVNKSPDDVCEKAHTNAYKLIHICGVIKPDMHYQQRGLCVSDIGSPLVIDDVVVGIAVRRNIDCDDTSKGSLYARMSFYKTFTDAILTNSLESLGKYLNAFRNRVYIYEQGQDKYTTDMLVE